MGLAMEVIAGRVTAPSTTFTAWTVNTGNSLAIRNAKLDARVWMLQMWADNQGAGNLRVRSPRLHDNVQGIRAVVAASIVKPLMPDYIRQSLIPQDVLVVEQTGSATAGDIEQGALLVYYEDIPGIEGRFLDEPTLKERTVSIVTVENTIATTATGDWGGEEAINAEFDLLKANTDYALVGYLVSAECGSVGWRGSDTGNLRVGGPGADDFGHITQNWFQRLARRYQMPMIPVFNSANKAGILVDATQDENGADVTITSILAELLPGTVTQLGRR